MLRRGFRLLLGLAALAWLSPPDIDAAPREPAEGLAGPATTKGPCETSAVLGSALSAWEVVSHSTQFQVEGSTIELLGIATCPPGKKVLGGGAASFVATSVPGREAELLQAADVPLVQSRPTGDGSAWIAKAVGFGPNPAETREYRLTVHAICAYVPATGDRPSGENEPVTDGPP